MRATTSQYEIQVAKITFAQSKPLHFFSNISNSLLSLFLSEDNRYSLHDVSEQSDEALPKNGS